MRMVARDRGPSTAGSCSSNAAGALGRVQGWRRSSRPQETDTCSTSRAGAFAQTIWTTRLQPGARARKGTRAVTSSRRRALSPSSLAEAFMKADAPVLATTSAPAPPAHDDTPPIVNRRSGIPMTSSRRRSPTRPSRDRGRVLRTLRKRRRRSCGPGSRRVTLIVLALETITKLHAALRRVRWLEHGDFCHCEECEDEQGTSGT